MPMRQLPQRLLKDRVDVNAAEIDGTTALHWAARINDAPTADLLIRAGADVKAANRYGVTPLSVACMSGNARGHQAAAESGSRCEYDAARRRIGADVGRAHRQSRRGQGVDRPRRRQSTRRKRSRAQTPLMWAASEGHAPVVRTLLEHGAELKARSTGGFTRTSVRGPRRTAGRGEDSAGRRRRRQRPVPGAARRAAPAAGAVCQARIRG